MTIYETARTADSAALAAELAALTEWLREHALPVWSVRGVDRCDGGFHEQLARNAGVIDQPRALSVRRCCQDAPVRPDADLYDHAFVLLGPAAAARQDLRRQSAVQTARTVVDSLVSEWKHPIAGFEESLTARESLSSNSHMHLLEAFLAIGRFIDQRTGGLHEHFDHNWNPTGDSTRRFFEPGNQFEWAWLLCRWGIARGRPADVFPIALRLTRLAEEHGINDRTGLALNRIWDDFSAAERSSRLWPQTERLRAGLAIAELSNGHQREAAARHATAAAAGMRRYFDTVIAGLWHETIDDQGTPVPGPARASSLYQIIGAIRALDRFVNHRRNHE